MKFRTTRKQVKLLNDNIIVIGYCDAQSLLTFTPATAYTAGVYGWNSDIHEINNAVIVTGYRPFGNIKPSRELLDEYEKRAKGICYDDTLKYEEAKKQVNELLDEFITITLKGAL